MIRVRPMLLGAALLGATSCKADKRPPSPGAAPSAAASASATASASADPRLQHLGPIRPLPSGPVLAILRGQGLGPIRFGATVQTIERLMGLPCDQRTDDVCRYPGHAIEFVLDDQGATKEIRLFALGRPVGGKPAGMFNGRFPSGLQLGMIRRAVLEFEGPPVRDEHIDGAGVGEIVERLHYDDMRVDLERQSDGDVAIATVTMYPAKKAGGAGNAAPASSR